MKQFLLILVCINLATCLSAQENTRSSILSRSNARTLGNSYAIVIGVSNYKNIKKLEYADHDAQAFAKFFASRTGGSIPDSNIYLFLNEKAIRTRIQDAISTVLKKVKANDRIYFYFAGHGDMEDLSQTDNGLLLLYDSPNGNYFGLTSDVLQIRDLKLYLASLTEKDIEVIFMIDACHSGNLKGGVRGLERTAAALLAEWNKEYKILSCQPNQLSKEGRQWGGGRGIFSLALEEGLGGLADDDHDKKVTYRELNIYLSNEVNKHSEGSQIPLLYGDLSRIIVTVDSVELAALKEKKRKNYPLLSSVKVKSTETNHYESLDNETRKIYDAFEKSIKSRNLIYPQLQNAYITYQTLIDKIPDHPIVPEMRITLAAALTERFDSIVAPIMRGGSSISSRNTCDTVAKELDACLKVLGSKHSMYNNILARKLYMEAMAKTWALYEYEFNEGINPVVEAAIKTLEESEFLEPSAPYTILALGSRYNFLAQYQKANEKFQKYLDLRPNDQRVKYSLGVLYNRQKQYPKAIEVFERLVSDNPNEIDYYWQLYDAQFKNEDRAAALAVARRVLARFGRKLGYEFLGEHYSKSNMLDSTVYYYNLLKREMRGDCQTCDNNIGYDYSMHRKFDSAKRYFNSMIRKDSLDPYANFNLGMIDAIYGDFRSAFYKFRIPALYEGYGDGFQNHFELYYNKRYRDSVSADFTKFSNNVFYFSVQYAAYSYILYCLLRDPELREEKELIQEVIASMKGFKEFEIFTWYHLACYYTLTGQSVDAMQSLEKALQGGFGYYFMLKNDMDLDGIRESEAFRSLMRKYFPNERN